MRDFSEYHNSNLIDRWLSENNYVFGTANNNYQKGAGYGFFGSAVYSRVTGDGIGDGHRTGDGNNVYPYQLIQYWHI